VKRKHPAEPSAPTPELFHAAENIEFVPIDSIKPYARNRNVHSDEQITRLVKLIQHHGNRNPLIVCSETREIIAGNGRFEALKRLGVPAVPVILQYFEDDDARYAYSVSDNAIADWAELDLSAINMDLAELGPDFDLDMLGIRNFGLDFWDEGKDVVDKLESNCDGIDAVFKVRCPQAIKDEVLILLKRAVLESSLEGVEIA
jgi:hypothetical protein